MLSAVSVLVFMCLVANGFALKCYTCDGVKSCKTPAEETCKGGKGFPPPDQCWVHRETITINGTETVITDKRMCMYGYRCMKFFHCKGTDENNVTCEAGCCKGDLCNHHGFKPAEPKYNKPSGADLSCFSCSDLPDYVLRRNLPVESAKCSKPAKKKCGYSTLETLTDDKLIQDRCITFKVTEKKQNSESKELVYRTCADMAFCSMNNKDWSTAFNQDMGTSPTVKASCCSGNLCNSGFSPHPQTSLTCLAGFLGIWLAKWMMVQTQYI